MLAHLDVCYKTASSAGKAPLDTGCLGKRVYHVRESYIIEGKQLLGRHCTSNVTHTLSFLAGKELSTSCTPRRRGINRSRAAQPQDVEGEVRHEKGYSRDEGRQLKVSRRSEAPSGLLFQRHQSPHADAIALEFLPCGSCRKRSPSSLPTSKKPYLRDYHDSKRVRIRSLSM